jgi:hypothetical protein
MWLLKDSAFLSHFFSKNILSTGSPLERREDDAGVFSFIN